jgi:hypothetical protein
MIDRFALSRPLSLCLSIDGTERAGGVFISFSQLANRIALKSIDYLKGDIIEQE